MSRKSKIDQIIKLTQSGWRAYEGQATATVYDNLDCEKNQRGRARWFAKGDLLVCIGCERACTLPCPEGFQLPLFKYPAPPSPIFRLAPDELLAKRKLLTVNEAAYVLNVSPRQIRNMIHEGRFQVTRNTPMRIPVAEVRASAEDVDMWTSAAEERLDDKARGLGYAG
jgi:excisionase family DNA binding protein